MPDPETRDARFEHETLTQLSVLSPATAILPRQSQRATGTRLREASRRAEHH